MKTLVLTLLVAVATLANAQIETKTHKMLDADNSFGIVFAVGGFSADAITTKGMLQRGYHEKDPLYKPFAGNYAAIPVETGALIGSMYLLHKTNHHRIEKALPWITGAVSIGFAIHNSRLR